MEPCSPSTSQIAFASSIAGSLDILPSAGPKRPPDRSSGLPVNSQGVGLRDDGVRRAATIAGGARHHAKANEHHCPGCWLRDRCYAGDAADADLAKIGDAAAVRIEADASDDRSAGCERTEEILTVTDRVIARRSIAEKQIDAARILRCVEQVELDLGKAKQRIGEIERECVQGIVSSEEASLTVGLGEKRLAVERLEGDGRVRLVRRSGDGQARQVVISLDILAGLNEAGRGRDRYSR